VKLLYLLRHAKSAVGEPGQDDHARPLNGRGRRASDRIGDVLAERGEPPEIVLCSSSRRTRETLDRVLERLSARPRVVIESDLYLADAPTLLAHLHGLSDDYERAMLVGHHPGIADLAEMLGTEGPRDLKQRLAEKFPTAALAIVELDGARWAEIGAGGTLVAFVLPRELESS